MEVSDFKPQDINHENGLFYDRPNTSEEGNEEALEQCSLPPQVLWFSLWMMTCSVQYAAQNSSLSPLSCHRDGLS